MSGDAEVRVPSRGRDLAGAFRTPGGDGPWPAALLISGSGPLDRDSTHKKMRFSVSKDLADDLAARGVASLRYDKHGVGATPGNWREAGFFDNAADAASALAWLQARPEVDPDRIVLIGHSEGAALAAHVATQADVAGVVLLSGAAQRGDVLLRWQARTIVPTLPAFVRSVLKVLRIDPVAKVAANHDKVRATTTDVARLGGARINARWMREFLDHDPAGDLARITVPVLAITGAKDLQVPVADLQVVERVHPGETTTMAVPDLTHTLRRQPDAPALSRYRKELKRPVDAEVLALVGDWVTQVTAAVSP